MRNVTQWFFGTLVLVVLVGVPVKYMNHRWTHYRNFRVVEDGKLYRSAQLSPEGLQRIVSEYGITTVISLRYSDRDEGAPQDAWEESWCKAQGMDYHRIRPRAWSGPEETVPAEQTIREFLKAIDEAKGPVLIHCFAGIHRTGAMCALYRMEYQGWSNEDAMREMQLIGYDRLDREQDVRDFLTNYRTRSMVGASEK